VSNVAGIAIPLVTGIGGLLVGGGFARVTSRNDQRRQQYAAGLSALDRLAAGDEDQNAVAESERAVVEIGNWLELDSVPVSNAFRLLVHETRASSAPRTDPKVLEARVRFIEAARMYSTWRLPQRFLLQARTERLD
jgi:hypothetical protein